MPLLNEATPLLNVAIPLLNVAIPLLKPLLAFVFSVIICKLNDLK